MSSWRSEAEQAWRRMRAEGVRSWLVLERHAVRQLVKTALAATIAWELAATVLHSRLPALAALAAILTVQVTVKQTVARGLQQVVGVVVGVLAALALARLLGVHAWSVGLVILAALLVGRLLRLGPQSNQVAISALLVLSLGAGYGTTRIYDTLLGALVGVVVNMLVAPPTYVQAGGAALRRVGEDVGVLLTEIGDGLAGGADHAAARRWLERARDLDRARSEAGEALRRGEESTHYNPLGRAEAESLARLDEGNVALEHVTSQTRGIARTLLELYRSAERLPPEVGQALASFGELLRHTGTAVAAFGRLQATNRETGGRDRTAGAGTGRAELARAHAAALASRDPVAAALRRVPVHEPVPGRMLASMLVDTDRLLHEVDPDRGAHTAALPATAS